MPTTLSVPRTYRPRGARIAASGVAVLLLAVVALLWVALPGEVRGAFSFAQRVTLLVIFGIIFVALYGLFRTAVYVDKAGITIVNVFRSTRLEWPAIVAINFSRGQPWAVLDVADGTTVNAMALQGADGQRAVRAVRELSMLLAEMTPVERDT